MEGKSKSDKWKITTDRFVCFLDIMGFKNLVAMSSHNEIYTMMKKIETSKKRYANLVWSGTNPGSVRTTTYSDSIMLYSKDETLESLKSVVYTAAALSYDLFIEGIPHKGSLAFGKMTLDTKRSIFFGTPLINAFLLQEELHYYGIVIHGSAEEKILPLMDKIAYIKEYSCPLKKGTTNHLTIQPTFIGGEEIYKSQVEAL